MNEPSVAELLERARAGNRQALEDLLLRHQATIYRFSLKMCRRPEDAEDVLQDTMLAMARSIRDFRGSSSLSTWLYTIARRFCLKKRKQREGKGTADPQVEREPTRELAKLPSPAQGPDDLAANKEVEDALGRALSALEPTAREVLILRDVEGLTAPEVAEVLGISVQAVKSRLHRARLAMREKVAPLLGIPLEPPPTPSACPDVLMLFSQHLEDEISSEVCATMERHLEGCPRCRGTCDSLKRSLALCHASGAAVDVPPKIQHTVKRALRDFLSTSSELI